MTDLELKRHLEDALTWEPSFDAADIGVTVDTGCPAKISAQTPLLLRRP